MTPADQTGRDPDLDLPFHEDAYICTGPYPCAGCVQHLPTTRKRYVPAAALAAERERSDRVEQGYRTALDHRTEESSRALAAAEKRIGRLVELLNRVVIEPVSPELICDIEEEIQEMTVDFDSWGWKRKPYKPAVERFNTRWALDPATGCWNWKGHIRKDGYASFSIGYVTKQAHRISYQMFKGPIPEGQQIDHTCKNKRCVNPDHLEAVTPRENTMRSDAITAQQAKRTTCPRGHEYDRFWGGHRYCRRCQTANGRARRANARV